MGVTASDPAARAGRRPAALAAVVALLVLGLPAAAGVARADGPRGTDRVCEAPFASDFDDIDGSAHEDNIRCMADHGIARGRGDRSYAPRAEVRRDQMASFIARFLEAAGGEELPEGDPDRFDDVPEDSPHAAAINALAEVGVVAGRGDGSYAPREVVRRDAMASFIRRAVSYLDDEQATNGSAPPDAGGRHFRDVPDGNVHADNIDALADQGVVAGFGDGTYRPRAEVRRDQMASFVMRGYDYAHEQGLTASAEEHQAGGNAGEVGDTEVGWADPDEATITPGVQLRTGGNQCTANFVFAEPVEDGTRPSSIYLGYAAHCAAVGGATAATTTNGCEAEVLDVGTQVAIEGASRPGRLAYSSWSTMLARGEDDADTCAYNDFALVAVHPDDHHRVNPTVPFWGGPEGVAGTSASGEKAYTYGNSSLRLGIELLSPKEGYVLLRTADGWNHQVYTVTPGIPGDSGSAVLDRRGRALGSIATVALVPFPASNGVTDLARALDYANEHGPVEVALAQGTEPFAGGLLP